MAYSYERSKTASFYDQSMQKLVQVVDKVSDGTKHLNLAERLCDDILAKLESDAEAANERRAYGAEQATSGVKTAVHNVRKAAKDLEASYDELNRWLTSQKMY